MCGCERPTLYSEKWVIARKPHQCCECFKTIAKGDDYQKIKGLWDGEFQEYETCLQCAELRIEIADTIRGCVLIGDLKKTALANGWGWAKK
jgi:hypothetical protein